MYFVSNTGRRSKGIDIRWIELTGFDSLFLFRDTKEKEFEVEGKWMEEGELFYRPSRFSTVHFTRADFNLISFSKKKGYYIIV